MPETKNPEPLKVGETREQVGLYHFLTKDKQNLHLEADSILRHYADVYVLYQDGQQVAHIDKVLAWWFSPE